MVSDARRGRSRCAPTVDRLAAARPISARAALLRRRSTFAPAAEQRRALGRRCTSTPSPSGFMCGDLARARGHPTVACRAGRSDDPRSHRLARVHDRRASMSAAESPRARRLRGLPVAPMVEREAGSSRDTRSLAQGRGADRGAANLDQTEARLRPIASRTRWSQVTHYFFEGVQVLEAARRAASGQRRDWQPGSGCR